MPLLAPMTPAKPSIVTLIDSIPSDTSKKGHGPIAERLLIEFMLALLPALLDSKIHRAVFFNRLIVGEMRLEAGYLPRQHR